MTMGKETEIQLISNFCKALSDISPHIEEDDLKHMGYILHMWRKGLSSNSSTRRMQKQLKQFLNGLMSTEEESVKRFAVYAKDLLKKMK